MPVSQGAASIPNLGRCHVAFRQKVTAQAVGNLAGINPIILLFRRGDGAQHQRMRHLYLGRVGQQMIIDPAREDRGFHAAFLQDLPARILDEIADRFLVNIQTDVIHTLHEEPPWLFSESTFPLSSAFCTPVLLTRLNIQTIPAGRGGSGCATTERLPAITIAAWRRASATRRSTPNRGSRRRCPRSRPGPINSQATRS